MTQRIIDKTSEKFRRVLSKTSGKIVKRQELITIAQVEFQLSNTQATGLIDRGILILKKYGMASPEGQKCNRGYLFPSNLWTEIIPISAGNAALALKEAKLNVETEIRLTSYELDAYDELLEKIPQEKPNINRLHKNTTEKFFQLHGKLRAIQQLISL
jgi:hypothetical protein